VRSDELLTTTDYLPLTTYYGLQMPDEPEHVIMHITTAHYLPLTTYYGLQMPDEPEHVIMHIFYSLQLTTYHSLPTTGCRCLTSPST